MHFTSVNSKKVKLYSPTSTCSISKYLLALFPALILTWRAHTFTLWGRLMLKSATACPVWCGMIVLFTMPPSKVIRVMRKNSDIRLMHILFNCRRRDEVKHACKEMRLNMQTTRARTTKKLTSMWMYNISESAVSLTVVLSTACDGRVNVEIRYR